MFEALAEQFEAAWKKLRGQDKLTPSNIQEALKVVRRALLDADVNVQVVREFIQEVERRAMPWRRSWVTGWCHLYRRYRPWQG